MLPLLNEDLRCFSVPVGQTRDTATSKIRHIEGIAERVVAVGPAGPFNFFLGLEKKSLLPCSFYSCAVPQATGPSNFTKKGRSIRLFSFVHSSTRVSRVFL